MIKTDRKVRNITKKSNGNKTTIESKKKIIIRPNLLLK